MNPIILKNHINKKDTIICNDHILYDSYFGSMFDKSFIFKIQASAEDADKYWQEIVNAINVGEGNTDSSDRMAEFASRYCRKTGNNDEMRQVILDAGDPKWAYYYCRWVNDDEDMRQVIIDSLDFEHPQNTAWAYCYCRDVSDDEDMRQAIINANDKEVAFNYLNNLAMKREKHEDLIA